MSTHTKKAFFLCQIVVYITFLIHPVFAQKQGTNHIIEKKYLNELGNQCITTIRYYDDLGREYQQVKKGYTTSGNDLVTHQVLDALGKIKEEILPVYTPTTGNPLTDTEALNLSCVQHNDDIPYTTHIYESGKERLIESFKPGKAWKDNNKSVKTDYLINSSQVAEKNAVLFSVSHDTILQMKGNYANGTLRVAKTIDEDGHTRLEFIDKRGYIVLERAILEDGERCDTYYVRDGLGKLVYVLPPIAVDRLLESAGNRWNPSEDILKKYAYYYEYAGLDKKSLSRLPGCEPVYYMYDASNQLMLTQDANLRERNYWKYYVRDVQGRIVEIGVAGSNRSRTEIMNATKSINSVVSKSKGTPTGYNTRELLNFTDGNIQPQEVSYYDDYGFVENTSFPEELKITYPSAAKGLVTAKNIQGVYTTYQYDDKARLVKEMIVNELGDLDTKEIAYTFSGEKLRFKHVYAPCSDVREGVSEQYDYMYDHSERLIKTTYQLNDYSPVVLSEIVYDEWDKMIEKKLHDSQYQIKYKYNIQDWLYSIQSDGFTQQLAYPDTDNGNNLNRCYNGNISSFKWEVVKESNLRNYHFYYDHLNRLVKAEYNDQLSLNYSTNYSYDKHGNIQTMQRYGKIDESGKYGIVDDLTYTYDGNQLKAVEDTGDDATYYNAFNFVDNSKNLEAEYVYGANGQLTQDANKKIASISYDLYCRPACIQFQNGNDISFGYSAEGKMLSKRYRYAISNIYVPLGSSMELSKDQVEREYLTNYCGNLMYHDNTLLQILTEDGFVVTYNGKAYYHYYLKDHQGNNRVVIYPNGNKKQVNHYYPFGGLFETKDYAVLTKQSYKYNGKKFCRIHGLDWYDFGSRCYDPAIARWLAMDPEAEKLYAWSPYAYCYNEPIRHVDPDGELPILGAFVGGGADYLLQVATNYATGVSDPWTNVDVTSIAVSAASSAVGAGIFNSLGKISKVANLAMKSKFAAKAVNVAKGAVSDAAVSVGGQLINNGSVDAGTVVADVVGGYSGSKAGDKVKSTYQTSSAAKALYKKARHDQRVAGSTPRESRRLRAEKSSQRAQNYGNKPAELVSTITSTAVSKVTEEIIKKNR